MSRVVVDILLAVIVLTDVLHMYRVNRLEKRIRELETKR